jgi:hypothetical protein
MIIWCVHLGIAGRGLWCQVNKRLVTAYLGIEVPYEGLNWMSWTLIHTDVVMSSPLEPLNGWWVLC